MIFGSNHSRVTAPKFTNLMMLHQPKIWIPPNHGEMPIIVMAY